MLPQHNPQAMQQIARVATDPTLALFREWITSEYHEYARACIHADGDPTLAGKAQAMEAFLHNLHQAANTH